MVILLSLYSKISYFLSLSQDLCRHILVYCAVTNTTITAIFLEETNDNFRKRFRCKANFTTATLLAHWKHLKLLLFSSQHIPSYRSHKSTCLSIQQIQQFYHTIKSSSETDPSCERHFGLNSLSIPYSVSNDATALFAKITAK